MTKGPRRKRGPVDQQVVETSGLLDLTQQCNVLQFPARGPFAVRIEREGDAWLAMCRDHGWLIGSRREALAEALEIARGFGVAVVEAVP